MGLGNLYIVKDSSDARTYYKDIIGRKVVLSSRVDEKLVNILDQRGIRWMVRPWDLVPLEDQQNADYVSMLRKEE